MDLRKPHIDRRSKALRRLSSAAMVLPGIVSSLAQAAEFTGSSVSYQYSQYEESQRDLVDVRSGRDPLSVEVFHADAQLMLNQGRFLTFSYTQDTWSGATPAATSPLAARPNRAILENTDNGVVAVGASPFLNTQVLLDQENTPLDFTTLLPDTRNVLVLSSASPESRDQLDFTVGQDWGDRAITAGFGVSLENDYESVYGNLNGRFDFNLNQTTLRLGIGYTTNEIGAILDPDILPYVTRTAYQDEIFRRGDSEILADKRYDWTASAGLTQIINRGSLLDINLGITHSTGFLENPYKATAVLFIDPQTQPIGTSQPTPADMRALLEQRPDARRQAVAGVEYVRYFEQSDAALHLEYQVSNDDWDITAHSLELEWVQPIINDWMVTPRLRYYTQSQANFYADYLISNQAFRKFARDDLGREIWKDNDNASATYFRNAQGDFFDINGIPVDPFALNLSPQTIAFDSGLLPRHFSSDHRLSAYGSVSASLTVSKSWRNGVRFETGLEYYERASNLKFGESGDSAFADFDFVAFNAAVSIDFNTAVARMPRMNGPMNMGSEDHNMSMHRNLAPAGIMFNHRLHEPGKIMFGYKSMFTRQAGDLLLGTRSADDASVVEFGCVGTAGCRNVPTYMNMKMHMFDVMYAPSANLTLMIMPQFVDMDMNLRDLEGRPPPLLEAHEHIGESGHSTGGLGDTILAAIFGIHNSAKHHLQAGIGLSAPTGQVELELRRTFRADGGLFHFGMQLGSGTWDFLPSITYSGTNAAWHWGAQLRGDYPLESANESGYRQGNATQLSTWGGYTFSPWVSASMRTTYTDQDAIQGDFNSLNSRLGPMDFPYNQGGQYVDLGIGLNISIPVGSLRGNQLAIEWLRPLRENVNGFQREREDMLSANWNFHF